ncbi:uncharacterized protein si:dkey-12e7.1 [Scyliorhinus canicula]|uniref:uncharacterized protein si:dkey-12e7.1 n=1 Tax=Scyliorhinus canicula TaxID=7830 RepID=UPI0018F4FCF9|nr:uncharacterized protein si:dkey-12e7.1 [Scyliorhinus canicula]
MPRKRKRVRPARAGGVQRGTGRELAGRQLFLFNALPPECQVYCFSFLSDVEKCRVALVCQGWSQLMRTSRLWQQADFACLGTFWGWEGALLSGARDHERWKERVENYAYHLMSRGASLLVLRASFDLGDEQTNWTQFLLRFLEGVNCRDLEELELNWTLNPLEPLPTNRQPSMTQVGMTKAGQVTNFQTLLERLGPVSPGLRQASLPFDWSERSVQLLTGFQQLKCLELKNFWVFKGVCPSSMHRLTRALPNLKRLILQVLIPVRDLEVTYTLESTSLEFLDVSQSRGLVFNLLNLPQLKELKIRKTIRGIVLNTQTQLDIQSRWPCLYTLLQEGVPNLRTLNHHQLLPSWQREADGDLAEVLAQACYCIQHSDTWLL